METAGWIAMFFVGLVLGLIGGGGAVLTVPVLAYLFLVPANVATGYSLWVVGLSSLIGAWISHRARLVRVPIGLTFAVPSFVGVFCARRFIVPAIPDRVGPIDKNSFLMLTFAALLLANGVRMLWPAKVDQAAANPSTLKLVVIASVVGVVAGIVGAGGGFLIIPALVLVAGIPMKEAVGTSLLIIGIQSSFGFLGDLGGTHKIDWPFLMAITGIAIGGLVVGRHFSNRIHGDKLRSGFAVFVLVMAAIIVARELL